MIGAALDIAIERHRGQVDKQGKPYLGHLLRVAARVADEEEAIAVALLHDIVEDTPTTAPDLMTLGFPVEVVEAVVLLTKDSSLTYVQNIKRLSVNRLAKKVKIADLVDNLDPSRQLPDSLGGPWMRVRYQKALDFLEGRNVEESQ